jgi:Leucine-rich repeat (LRR) protein
VKSLWFIPNLSRLRNLEILDLSFNYFSGSFPSLVGSLTGLVQLGLGENNFDGGSASVSHSLTFFFRVEGGILLSKDPWARD